MGFDLKNFFKIDISDGSISYEGWDEGAFVVPESAMVAVLKWCDSEEKKDVVFKLGWELGRFFGRRINENYQGRGMEAVVSPEDFLHDVNSIISVHGLGVVEMERWADVVFFIWKGKVARLLEEGVLKGILSEFSGLDFDVVLVGDDGQQRRKYLIGNEEMISGARRWLDEGLGEGEIVQKLLSGQHLLNGV